MYYTASHTGTTGARTQGGSPPGFDYSRDTSRPKTLDFAQSFMTRRRFRARSIKSADDRDGQERVGHLLLKHIERYALLQNRYVQVPPDATLPLNQATSATAFSLPMYAKLPWCE